MDSYDFRRAIASADHEAEGTVPVVIRVGDTLYDVERVEYTELDAPQIMITAVPIR